MAYLCALPGMDWSYERTTPFLDLFKKLVEDLYDSQNS